MDARLGIEDLPRRHRPRDVLSGILAAFVLVLGCLAAGRAAWLFLRLATWLLPFALVAGLIAFAAFRIQFGSLRNRRGI